MKQTSGKEKQSQKENQPIRAETQVRMRSSCSEAAALRGPTRIQICPL